MLWEFHLNQGGQALQEVSAAEMPRDGFGKTLSAYFSSVTEIGVKCLHDTTQVFRYYAWA